MPPVVLSFIIVASGNNDVHSDHTQDEHVEHRGPHQLLWKQSSIALQSIATNRQSGDKKYEANQWVFSFVSYQNFSFDLYIAILKIITSRIVKLGGSAFTSDGYDKSYSDSH